MISIRIPTNPIGTRGSEPPIPYYSTSAEDDDLEAQLIQVKNSQDAYYANWQFARVARTYDPFLRFKRILQKRHDIPNITNAWLKIYEILTSFDLAPAGSELRPFTHFDNAAFPGAFITATNHYVRTRRRKTYSQYRWFASSWTPKSAKDIRTGTPLGDTYRLYRRHKKNWLMSDTNDGNVLTVANQDDWEARLNHSVDLYTSDLGFETGADGDYNKQEDSHVLSNLGQILAGVLTLTNGGHLVVKQYTFFDTLNVSVYAVLTNLFTEVYVCKPQTSRAPNSETYIVCKSFGGPFPPESNGHKLISVMRTHLARQSRQPLVLKKCLGEAFLRSIHEARKVFVSRQIAAIKDRHAWFDQKRNLRAAHKQQQDIFLLRNPVFSLPWHDRI